MHVLLIPQPRKKRADVESAVFALEKKLAYYKTLLKVLDGDQEITLDNLDANKVPVTTALMMVLKKLKIRTYSVFSDTRTPKEYNISKAVSVKLSRVSLTKIQLDTIVKEMTNLGYIFVYYTPAVSDSKRGPGHVS